MLLCQGKEQFWGTEETENGWIVDEVQVHGLNEKNCLQLLAEGHVSNLETERN